MKVISREKIGSAKLQENLDSEISIMRDYKHENIVQLYEHFVSLLLFFISNFISNFVLFIFLDIISSYLFSFRILSWRRFTKIYT